MVQTSPGLIRAFFGLAQTEMLEMWTLSINIAEAEGLGMDIVIDDISMEDADAGIDIVMVADVAGLRFDILMLLEPIDIDIDMPPP